MGIRLSEQDRVPNLETGDLLQITRENPAISITASTISADSFNNKLVDSGAGFLAAGFLEGQSIKTSGFSNGENNIDSVRIESVTATDLVLSDDVSLVDEAEGQSVSVVKLKTYATPYSAPAASGDVVGPASATENAIPLFDGTTGKLLSDSAKTISTDGTLASDSDSLIPTEKAVKTYVDANAGGSNTFSGALVRPAANITSVNATSGYFIPFDSEVYDTDGFHDNVTNNTRLTVAVDGLHEVTGMLNLISATVGTWFQFILFKNGTIAFDGFAGLQKDAEDQAFYANFQTPPIDCVAGDYFEVRLFAESDTNVTIQASTSSFAIKRIGVLPAP